MIYISGKITAPTEEEIQQNLKVFDVKEAELKAQGYEVFNPAKLEVDNTQFKNMNERWSHYIVRDIIWIFIHRPTIYVMKGWENSRGVMCEIETAKYLGLKIIYE